MVFYSILGEFGRDSVSGGRRVGFGANGGRDAAGSGCGNVLDAVDAARECLASSQAERLISARAAPPGGDAAKPAFLGWLSADTVVVVYERGEVVAFRVAPPPPVIGGVVPPGAGPPL